jgi:hypothetical protein
VKWYFTQEVVSFGCGLEKIIQWLQYIWIQQNHVQSTVLL